MIRTAAALEIIEAQRGRFEEVFQWAAVRDSALEHFVVAATAIARPHMWHEHSNDPVALLQKVANRPLQTVSNIFGRRIIIQRASVAVMHHHQLPIWMLRDEMISQTLQPWRQL